MDCNKTSMDSEWNRLADAVAFALQAHAQQERKGTDTPYVSHLLGVASLVLEHGDDEEQAMAAMLHDAVEDQGAHLELVIHERFGARVADIVLGCTDADTVPKPPWRERKEAYIRHLETAGTEVLLVSCADKVHNARAICTDVRAHGPEVFDRFKAGQDGTLWYHRTLAAAFRRLMPGALADELSGAVDTMERLPGINGTGQAAWLRKLDALEAPPSQRIIDFLDSCADLDVSWSLNKVLLARMRAGGSTVEFLAVEPDGRVQLPWSIDGRKDEFRCFAETLAAGIPGAMVFETPKQWNVGDTDREPLGLLQVLGSTKALRSALEALHAALQAPA